MLYRHGTCANWNLGRIHAPTVGLLLHKTDSGPQKLPELAYFLSFTADISCRVSGILVAF